MDRTITPRLDRIAVIGNYQPRQCGIATFTTDLAEAFAGEYPAITCDVLAVNDREEGYAYPSRVKFELAQDDEDSYRRAADWLNVRGVDLVLLQHEYGIFGGPAGSHILTLLRQLRMPVVTTLHTILRAPNPEQRRVLEEIADRSERLVVMSRLGCELLQAIYRVPAGKIDLIPHGIPDVPFSDPDCCKGQFGLDGKLTMLTFGLLSPNKGIEQVIAALPRILSRYPNFAYLVVGATHPHVKARDGEAYRDSLHDLARGLGVAQSVIFHDGFVGIEQLVNYISAADLYITPYLGREQIVSGTLAYTVGAGKAVISTPYSYAEELLADRRGVLVPFGDAEAIADTVLSLLDNGAERQALRQRAYRFGREMTWSNVARRYLESFELACAEVVSRTPAVLAGRLSGVTPTVA